MKTPCGITLAVLAVGSWAVAQTQESNKGWRDAPAAGSQPQSPGTFVVKAGTRIPLALINSVSTKQAAPGDHVYLESVFPVMVDGKTVIPAGSHVSGTVTKSRRPGRVKARGALYIRFDSMILPNGVTRDFRARVGGLDASASGQLDRKEGKITGKGNKARDARTVAGSVAAGTTGCGAGIGGAICAAIGTVAGATAGLGAVLLTRGPDAVLARGTQLDMVLDRDLFFTEAEIQFPKAP